MGGCEANFSLAVSLPSIATSSSRTILMTCSPGERAVSDLLADGLGRIWSISCLTTLKLTSASSSARRISRSASWMFSSVRTCLPAQGFEGALKFF